MTEYRGHFAARKGRPRVTQPTAQPPQRTHQIHGGSDVSRLSSDQPSTSRRERLSDIDRVRRNNDAGSAASSLRIIEPAPITVDRRRADSPVRRSSPRRSLEPSMNRSTPQLVASTTLRTEERARARGRDQPLPRSRSRRRSRSGEMRDALGKLLTVLEVIQRRSQSI